MPKIQNSFLKGKMNKDLDERLVPKGEYREAQNILITQSENSDVGAVENIQGNAKILSSAFLREDSTIETIGYFADTLNKRAFWFVTNFTGDDGDIRNMSRAQSSNTCGIIMGDLNGSETSAKLLVSGHFLNFSKDHLITGVNLIDDLLFWTDNYNQPRKINVTKAIADSSYYVNEKQISVAKVAPYLAPILHDSTGAADGVTLTRDDDVTSDYLKDKFVRFSYRYKYEDGEYTTIAPFTQIVFKPLNDGLIDSVLTTDREKTDNQDVYSKTIVDVMKNHYNKVEIRVPLPGEDAETNAGASWDNELRISKIEILIKESDQDVVKVIKEIDVVDERGDTLQDFTSNVENYSLSPNGTDVYYRKVYKHTYRSEQPYKILEDKQITRVFDQVPLRAQAQEISGNRIIYGNFTENYDLPKDDSGKTGLNYVIRIGSKGDVEYNRSLYSPSGYVRKENNNNVYKNHSIKQAREYQVGIILADKFGRQSPVILSTASQQDLDPNIVIPEEIDTIKVDYKTSDLSELYTEAGTGNKFYSWSTNQVAVGQALSIKFNENEIIPFKEVYNGDIDDKYYNPYGWYSYKVVVKQQEQEYYNVYTNHPADHWNNESNSHDDVLGFSWISLYGDNINKVPRDVTEVGDVTENVAGSDTKLFPKVVKSSIEGDNLSVMGQDQDPIEVMTVGTAREQGILTEGDRDKDRVHDFVMAKRNPLLAQVKSLNNSENNRVLYKITIPIFESNEDDNSYVLVGDGNVINPFIRVGQQISETGFNTQSSDGSIQPVRVGKLVQKIRLDNNEQEGFETKIVVDDGTNFIANNLTKASVGQFIDYRSSSDDDNPQSDGQYFGLSTLEEFNQDGFIFTTATTVQHGNETTVRRPIVEKVEFNDAGTRMSIHCDRRIFPAGIKDQSSFISSTDQMMGLYEPILIESVETESRVVDGEIKYFQKIKLSHDLDFIANQTLVIQNIEEKPIAVSTGLTVLETDPVKSNLDIFYESSTSGLIKDLNDFDPGSGNLIDIPGLKQIEVSYFNTFILAGGGTSSANKPGIFHIEESRIKGEYNGISTDYGVKAHVVDDNYASRVRTNALIHSGIFNAKTQVNETNQFSIGESITKAVDIQNGSIQKLYAEDTNLIIFQENKVSRALIDKDAIFTAEGQPLTTSSKVVIGQIGSFGGKYGICKNPESFAVYGGRKYFADKNRGTIMRLSQDGLTPISNAGMRSFFRDNLPNTKRIYGMYDEQKNKYVVSLQNETEASTYLFEYGSADGSTSSTKDTYATLSYDEASKGWVSFYTYKPTFGFSLSNEFYTYNNQDIYQHYSDTVQRCKFYTSTYNDPANIEFVFNDQPSTVKNFHTVEYEGTTGWKMASAETDMHVAYPVLSSDTTVSSLSIPVNFINKENKYYGHIRNNTTTTALNQIVGVDLSGIKGYFNKVKMQYWKPDEAIASAVSKGELYAVNSETVYSSQ